MYDKNNFFKWSLNRKGLFVVLKVLKESVYHLIDNWPFNEQYIKKYYPYI